MAINLDEIIWKQYERISVLEKKLNYLKENREFYNSIELKDELEDIKIRYGKIANVTDRIAEEVKSFKDSHREDKYTYSVESLEKYMTKLREMQEGVKIEVNEIEENRYEKHPVADDDIESLEEFNIQEYSLEDEIEDMLKSEEYKKQQVDEKEEDVSIEELLSSQEITEYQEEKQIEDLLAKQEITTVKEDNLEPKDRKNKIESFIGLNLINKLGILLILLGTIALGRLAYIYLTDLVRGIVIFIIGGAMVLIGELLNKKKQNIFSLGITSGGIAVLYSGITMSYFYLNILNSGSALLLCILVTAGAVLLSMRYNSQTIACFGLIGGYIPIVSVILDENMLIGVIIYFMVLNLAIITLSFNKKWIVTNYLALGLNLLGNIGLGSLVHEESDSIYKYSYLLYVILTYLIYLLVPIISSYKNKIEFKISEKAFVITNVINSSLIMYAMALRLGYGDYLGVLSIAYAVIYLALSKLASKYLEERSMQSLFLAFGVVAVILIVPCQLDKKWITLGWLAEGVPFALYGILKDDNASKKAGLSMCGLSALNLLLVDSTYYSEFFFQKYTMVTIASIVILVAYMDKEKMESISKKIYANGVILNIWAYCIYVIITELVFKLKNSGMFNNMLNTKYIEMALITLVTFGIAYTIRKQKILKETITKWIPYTMLGIGFFVTIINNNQSIFNRHGVGENSLPVTVVGSVVLALVTLVSVIMLRDFLKPFVEGGKMREQLYYAFVTIYAVVIITQNLIIQYYVPFESIILSIVYMILSLILIIIGFRKKFTFFRRIGLGLSVITVFKMFWIDFSEVTQVYKIVSYFIFGLILLGISFLYQYFYKLVEGDDDIDK